MGMLIWYLIEGFFALGFVLASIIEMVLIFKDGFQMMPFIGSVIVLNYNLYANDNKSTRKRKS